MSTVTQASLTKKQKVSLWVKADRGILKRIATKAERSLGFVWLVAYGDRKSADGNIERLLGKAGAPGFSRTKRGK